jgi:hypothetical protein
LGKGKNSKIQNRKNFRSEIFYLLLQQQKWSLHWRDQISTKKTVKKILKNNFWSHGVQEKWSILKRKWISKIDFLSYWLIKNFFNKKMIWKWSEGGVESCFWFWNFLTWITAMKTLLKIVVYARSFHHYTFSALCFQPEWVFGTMSKWFSARAKRGQKKFSTEWQKWTRDEINGEKV